MILPLHRIFILCAAASLFVVVLTFAASRVADGPLDRWTDRLAAVDPHQPLTYFMLAEEIVSEGSTTAEATLARQLFALSGVLDPSHFGRSAALGIAANEDPSSPDGARIKSAALALARMRAKKMESGQTTQITRASIVLAAGAASHIRAGRMGSASEALKVPTTRKAFDSVVIDVDGGPKRLIMDMQGLREGTRPHLSAHDIEVALVGVAAALESSDDRWSYALARTQRAPLVWVDERQLAVIAGVNPAATAWKNGAWTVPSASESSPQ
ncbi:MAG: hypothetical protein O2800_02830 [Planctomycetota bacterium]|nr:hypothetical protein [Planctomycetota bacterium]